MCGIAGAFAYRGPPVDRDELIAVRDAMISRGPDDFGAWYSPDGRLGLVHRRLSIIDLSASGSQPMAWSDGNYRIVFNGEIYNHRELRRELEGKGYRFRSTSDTEVLLALYVDRGEEMVKALRGMFAFALWDEKRRTLFLARDPFGIKPLYFADDGTTFRFASQVKPLASVISSPPDPAGHAGFFLLGSVPEPHTLYRNIRALPAGCALRLTEAGSCQLAYCDVSDVLREVDRVPGTLDREVALSRIHEALRDSVRAHLVADVPIGVFLSAGLDSTAIATLVAEVGEAELRTVTLGFEEFRDTDNDETGLAREVAQLLGAYHSEYRVSRQDFFDDKEKLLAAMDQPSIDGVNSYFVSKAAAAVGLKVALSGLGGDELFGSYSSFRDVPRMVRVLGPLACVPGLGRLFRVVSHRLLGRFTSPKYAGLLEYGSDYGGAYLLRRGLFMPWELPELLGPDMAREGWSELALRLRLSDTVSGIRNPQLKVTALETAWYMRNQLLRDADWAGMAHSIEIRVPLVDLALYRTLAPLLGSLAGVSKRDVLRRCVETLPAKILDRPKTGFSIPVRRWLSEDAVQSSDTRGLRGWARNLYAAGGWQL